ncbi:putative cyclic nucleotide-gated ion channel 5 [Gossypium australe]|uniref:Putative cyclic nucleotide-gated ion channel 5 n=1 Tax=Gossypium australe TaxID=47621 RepID=A0A5B6W1M4_9ROSI|nr:putative cyclic nucleotide-gated ion channel 5 [Gossypium australe]
MQTMQHLDLSREGSQGLKSIGRSLGFGVSRVVFPEDLKRTLYCLFFLPVINDPEKCLTIDKSLAVTATTLRTIIDAFYLIRMALQFRTAYIAPSARVFRRGELVIDPARIAKRYMLQYFFLDFLAVLPLPQCETREQPMVCVAYMDYVKNVLATNEALFFTVLFQYIPRFLRVIPLTSEMKRTTGVFAETAWAGAAYYLLIPKILLRISFNIFAVPLARTVDASSYASQDLRERVRRYDQYKWLETRGVDEENLVQSLPKDLRRDIKMIGSMLYYLRLVDDLVPLFESMDERLLDAICERPVYREHLYSPRGGSC